MQAGVPAKGMIIDTGFIPVEMYICGVNSINGSLADRVDLLRKDNGSTAEYIAKHTVGHIFHIHHHTVYCISKRKSGRRKINCIFAAVAGIFYFV
ncbi:hypothetical protein Barb7_02291 [Bacteroidales bacterium Barb7]|nr:hypothetical protein Barb7_02291 [Bacteroidales bacterium Barb7]